MYDLGRPLTMALLAIALAMFGLAAAAFRHRSRRVATPLAAFLTGVGLWTLGDGIRVAAPNATHVLFWNKVAYLGVVMVPPTYIFTVAAVTNRERWFRRRYVYGTAGISLLALALILTNSWHHLWHADKTFAAGTAPPVVLEEWGIAWYFWATYVYVVTFFGVYILAKDLFRASRSSLYRNQVALLFVGILVPLLANLLFTVFDVVQWDPLPVALSVTGVTFSAAIFRYDLLDITPIARDVVLDNVDSGVLVLDADDAVVDANERARRVLEVDPQDLPGIDIRTLLSEYPDAVDHLEGTRRASESIAIDTEDGLRHYEVEVSPVKDDLGIYLGRIIVFKDVTDRIQRERNLRDRTERLERQNERLDELASIVSHDLRNPLDVSGQRARRLRQILSESDIDPETASEIREQVAGIERATERAAEISEDLVTISEDQGKDSSGEEFDHGDESRTVALRSVAADAWDTVDTGDLDLTIRGSRPVVADETELRRLLENCFRNSAEHADGAGSVVVGASSEGFYVEDDGPGLPAAGEQVLEPGFTTAPDGSGLGLAIVEEVADDHGWDVEVTDGDDGGLRVDVTLEPPKK